MEGDRDRAGDGGAACFLGSGSGVPEADLDEDPLLTECGLGVEALRKEQR